jgi:UDP-arabinose 4-epimerase
MDTVLVTGGAGYVGSHACKALARRGMLPVTFDSLVTGHRAAVKWGPFEHGDLADRSRLGDVIQTYKPKAVLHFAASAYVGESVTDPAKYYRNNVGATLSLLECLRGSDCRKIVISSSCATYGIPDRLPLTEDTPQAPINPYGRSKLMVEHILQDYCQSYDLAGTALRYFNAAGADLENEIGESHDPETHLIPLVLQAAGSPETPLTMMGDDYPTPDGTCIRDYVHVTDLADAHVKAIGYLADAHGFSAFNLGTGHGYSVRSIIDTVEDVTRLAVAVKRGARRPGDPAALIASTVKAQEVLGWTAQHSDIGTIVRTAWAWANTR